MRAVLPVLLAAAAATASAPSPACAPTADAWCNAVRPDDGSPLNCDASIADGPLVALFDTDARGGAKQWRCYSRSTLDPGRSKYVSGTGYCSRQSQLTDELRNCAAGIVTDPVPVFNHGETDVLLNRTYPCIRIPSITRLWDGSLVAFAECRHWVGDGCDPVTGAGKEPLAYNDWRDLCIKSSKDEGATWGPLRTISNCTDQPNPVVIPPAAGKGGPGTLVVHANRCGADPADPKAVVQLTSADGGDTWSSPQSLVPSLGKDAGYSYVGPGVGLRLSEDHPTAPGRLLFIGHLGAYGHDYVWYSDDGAKTWTASDTSGLGKTDEAQLVQVPPHAAAALGVPAGSVMANLRTNHLNRSCDCRAVSVSTDGGATFASLGWDPALVSPVCQATIVSGPAPPGQAAAQALYFANPASPTSRNNGTVRASFDGSATWAGSVTVSESGYAYSCLLPPVAGPRSEVGLLWETSGSSFECNGVSCRTMFSRVPTALLAV